MVCRKCVNYRVKHGFPYCDHGVHMRENHPAFGTCDYYESVLVHGDPSST